MKKKYVDNYFLQVSPNDDQMFRITDKFEMQIIDNKIKAEQEAADIMSKCKLQAESFIASKKKEKGGTAEVDDTAYAQQAMESLSECVENQVSLTLEKINEEIAFQSQIRRDIAATLENYTCVDDTLNSTNDIDTEIWIQPNRYGTGDKIGEVERTVHIKHERPASKIHVIENFITELECKAMELAAEKKLHRATVADGKGGSELSENRKAMQAGIIVNWSKEQEGDPIARLSRRVYDYTNHVLGMNIEEHGQEDLMSIQVRSR